MTENIERAPSSRLLTVREAADRIGRTEASVRWLIHQGTFAKTAVVGGRRVTRESDLQAWIDAAFAQAS
ncbi:AlpA family transcriptional regulator [Rathayibacter sp. AY1A7]|uniref:helix-turn-helix transcriptional regulator n=1 Tax=Rathayibacter sp. AY1A7 TaxID=2080524 RepID=UPI000CE92B72|nr:helix-turn-helix domain-containing protein [Rathayibacter sp. AY1A7]PPF14484.1 helix-turn-helix domain-containing protein [Rathayibacter sp. AY1A7]